MYGHTEHVEAMVKTLDFLKNRKDDLYIQDSNIS